MEYVKGVALVRAFGGNATLQCITSLTASARCIYGLLASMGTNAEAPNIMLLIKESDLERKTRLLESVLSDIDMKVHYTNSLARCITDLNNCLDEIKAMLDIVHKRSSYNKSLWLLKRARTYGFTDIYTSLKVAIMNLDDRRQSLFDVLSINHRLVEGTPPVHTQDVIDEGHLLVECKKGQ